MADVTKKNPVVRLIFEVEVDMDNFDTYYKEYPDLANLDEYKVEETLAREALVQWQTYGIIDPDRPFYAWVQVPVSVDVPLKASQDEPA